jgi:hypothetical protein
MDEEFIKLCGQGYVIMVSLALNAGATVSPASYKAAMSNGDPNIIEMLLDQVGSDKYDQYLKLTLKYGEGVRLRIGLRYFLDKGVCFSERHYRYIPYVFKNLRPKPYETQNEEVKVLLDQIISLRVLDNDRELLNKSVIAYHYTSNGDISLFDRYLHLIDHDILIKCASRNLWKPDVFIKLLSYIDSLKYSKILNDILIEYFDYDRSLEALKYLMSEGATVDADTLIETSRIHNARFIIDKLDIDDMTKYKLEQALTEFHETERELKQALDETMD